MSMPRVLILTTIYEAKDYCLKDFDKRVKELTYKNVHHVYIDNSKSTRYVNKLRRMGLNAYHVDRGSSSREAIARSLNFGRKIFLEGDYDYLFVLESDVFPPQNIIEALLIQAKDVISGLYFIGNDKVRVPCITLDEYNKENCAWGTRLLHPSEFKEYCNNGVRKVQAGSFGVCLIARHIVEKTPFYFCPELKGHPDIYFFNAMKNNNIPVFVHTNAICAHENSDWKKVEDR